MWLADYLRKRWGLFSLVTAVTMVGLVLSGGGSKDPQGAPPKAPSHSFGAPSPKNLSPGAVKSLCARQGIHVTDPPTANPKGIRHPGFPPPRKTPPSLGKAGRGLFPLQEKLMGLGERRPGHARLLHRLAAGFAQRYRYFAYLAGSRKAARRYYRRRAARRMQPAPTGGGATGAAPQPTPPAQAILQKALGYRRRALRYYRELATSRALARYGRRPAALLEYAILLAKKPANTRRRKGARPSRDEPTRILHKLWDEHPGSPEAVEASSLLAHRMAARGLCAKVVFLLKKLPTTPLDPKTPPRRALLRGLAHFHAGVCLLKQGSHAAAARRLATAMADANQARRGGSKAAASLAREAAIAWARAYGAAGDLTRPRARLASLGSAVAPVATAVLASQLIKEGALRAAMELCAPAVPAPTGAK